MPVYYVVVFSVGIIIGWFVNICIKRLPEGKPLFSPLNRQDERVGRPRDVLVIVLTAAVLTVLYARYSFSAQFLAFSYLMILLMAVFFIDLDHKIIPDEIVIAGLIGGIPVFLYNMFHPMEIYLDDKWWNPLLGILPGSGILFLIAVLGMLVYKSNDAMGMGDVKLFAPIGIFLGWRMCFFSLFISIVTAGIFSMLLMALKIKNRRDVIPFGPFIVTGTFITILWGVDILNWYLN